MVSIQAEKYGSAVEFWEAFCRDVCAILSLSIGDVYLRSDDNPSVGATRCNCRNCAEVGPFMVAILGATHTTCNPIDKSISNTRKLRESPLFIFLIVLLKKPTIEASEDDDDERMKDAAIFSKLPSWIVRI